MIDVPLLIDAARFALSRVTLSTADLGEQLLVDRVTAARLMSQLHRWDIVSVQIGSKPRMVLLLPAHETLVVGTILRHGGIPPLDNPLLAHTHPGLTDRWRQVLDLVAEGYDNPEIGRRLYLGARTVKGHIERLCRAHNARNRVHLVTVAHQRGLLPNPHKTIPSLDAGGAS